MAFTEVILVDDCDQPLGSMEKLRAHREGVLHRAVSVYLFTPAGEVLLQRRDGGKYHCGGLWSNTCCGHPLPGEDTAAAARRRLEEEMGLRCGLTPIFTLQYRLPLANGLIEHEVGHVFFGISSQTPRPNPAEVMDYRYLPMAALLDETRREPARFTPWFLLTLPAIPEYVAAFRRLKCAG